MDFETFPRKYAELLAEAASIPLGCYAPLPWPLTDEVKPRVMLFSAHPDDECLSYGPLALRFRENASRVTNIAMTYGRAAQIERRKSELAAACDFLGWETRALKDQEDDTHNETMQRRYDLLAMIQLLQDEHPDVIMVHHGDDWHPKHVRTNTLVRAAIESTAWSGHLFEAEYWRDMLGPNLMLEVSAHDIAILLKALSFHVGELERNPYHLSWLADMTRNVRRSEIVLGRGSAVPQIDFAVLYRRYACSDGRLRYSSPNPPVIRQMVGSIASVLS